MLLLMFYDEKKGNLCCCCLTILWDRKNVSLSQIILHRLTLTFSLHIYSIKYRKIWKENSYNWNLNDKHCWKVLTHSNCAGNIYLPLLQVCGHRSENVRIDDLGATVATFELINVSVDIIETMNILWLMSLLYFPQTFSYLNTLTVVSDQESPFWLANKVHFFNSTARGGV